MVDIISGRSCGDCTLCCTLLGVESPDLQKPVGVTCSHLCDTGCGIYETKPEVCTSWTCMWLDGIGPEKWWPHSSRWVGVIDFSPLSLSLLSEGPAWREAEEFMCELSRRRSLEIYVSESPNELTYIVSKGEVGRNPKLVE